MAKDRVIRIGTELDTSGMLQGINKMRQMINSIGVDSSLFKDVDKDLDKITKLTNSIAASLKGGISEQDIKPLLKDLDTASKIYSTLPSKIRQVSISTNDIRFPKETIDRLDEIQLEIESLGEAARKSLGTDLKNNLRKAIPTDLIDDKTLTNITKADDKANSFINTITNIKEAAKESKRALDGLVISLSSPKAIPPGASARQIQNLTAQNANSLGFSNILAQSMANGTLEQDRTSLGQLYSNLGVKSEQVTKFLGQIDEYVAAQKRANEIDGIRQQVLDILTNANSTAADATARIAQLIQEQNSIEEQALRDSTEMKEEAAKASEELADANVKSMEETSDSVDKANDHLQRQDSLLKQLASRATSLIGIGAVFNYITRGVRDAWSKIKDLDKEFTSIAVVTDKTTSQLWQSFSTYSQMAQSLGIATKDAVATSALYYQQGLKTAEVMTLTAETIRMAQIAGMDFKTATNQMTAALRGFNLEMDQASMVNDIFSTLAANAAVDTKELSYALTKTASIAESAGMSIDTTSAFLAKMIETTREAPENIGTAMKSIVARFEELKKNPLALSVDVEGEEVVANKVEAAIALAGVKLRDETTGQFRDLDDVFLELAKSWETLDRNTQRYIATIAAGSRQQSRFIALMDGYDRTLELVELAQDSEGQSAAQFLKTLDSLDSKLNKISNSLESLYQKFVNSDFFGGLLDGLNSLLQKAGEMDAGQLAVFLGAGVIIGNNIIKGIQQAIKSTDLNSFGLKDKITNTFTKRIVKSASVHSANFENNNNLRKMSYVGLASNLNGKYNINLTDSLKKLSQTRNEIDQLNAKISQDKIFNINTTKAEQDLEKLRQEEKIIRTDLVNEITQAGDNGTLIGSRTEAYKDLVGSLDEAEQEIGTKIDEINKEANTRFAKNSEVIKQNVGQLFFNTGTALVTSLSLGISTALSADNPWEAIFAATSTFALQMLPQLFSIMASAAGKGMAGIRAAVDAAGGWITLAIEGIVMLITGAAALITWTVKNWKSDIQKLEEEINSLKDKQKDLQEATERSNAEAAVEKTKYKNLNKLIEGYDELIDKTNRTTEENEKLKSIINSISTDFPDLVISYNEAGEAVLKQRNAWQDIVNSQKESLSLANAQAASDNLKLAQNKLYIAQKENELAENSTINYFKTGMFSGSGLGKEKALNANGVIDFLSEKTDTTRVSGRQVQFFEYLLNSEDNEDKIGGLLGFKGNDYTNFGIQKEITSKDMSDFLSKYLQESSLEGQKEILKDFFVNTLEAQDADFVSEIIDNASYNIIEFNSKIKDLIELYDENGTYKQKENDAMSNVVEVIKSSIKGYVQLEDGINDYSDKLQTLTIKGLVENSPEVKKVKNMSVEEVMKGEGATEDFKSIIKSNKLSQITRQKLQTNSLDEYTDYTKIDEDKQKIVAEAIEEYMNVIYQEVAKDSIKGLNLIKDRLSEEEFNLINEKDFGNIGTEKLTGIANNIRIFDENTANQIDKYVSEIEEKYTDTFKTIAQKFGENITQKLIDNNTTEKVAGKLLGIFEGIEDKSAGIMDIINNPQTDLGNVDQLKQLANYFVAAGNNAKDAVDHVLELRDVLTKININTDFNAIMTDLGEKVSEIQKNYSDLNTAIEEYNNNGRLSAETVLGLIQAGQAQYLEYDKLNQVVKINTDLVEESWKEEIKSAKTKLQVSIDDRKRAIAGLQLEIELNNQKIKILEQAKDKNYTIQKDQYEKLLNLNKTHAVNVLNGQIEIDNDSLQQNQLFFDNLFTESKENYNDLINLALQSGTAIRQALIDGMSGNSDTSQALSLVTQTLSNSFENAPVLDNLISQEAAKYFDQMSGTYLLSIDPEKTEEYKKYYEDQNKNLLQTVDLLTKQNDEASKSLEIYDEMYTNRSMSEVFADTAKAAKDANKELEDYISTLERYYTLQKRIEKLEDERQKALKRYKKTGSQEDLDEYVSKSLLKLEDASRLAYVGKKDKERILPEAKEKLSKYFTKDELDKLQYDEYTGLLDLDSFYETKAYKAKTQDKEQGQKIDDILKDALSDTETAQGWIDAFEEERLNLVEEFEKEKEELEKIEKSIDRLQNVNRALESINKLLEDAKDDNDEYYATGGKEGISGLQYLRAEAQKITAQTQSMGEYGKYQEEIGQQLLSKDLMKYIDLNEGDNKLYLKPEKFQEYIGLLQTEDGQKLADTLDTLIEKYNSLTDATHDAEKAQKDEAKAMRDFAKSLRKSYSDLITRLADDMAKLDQKEIDEVKKKYQMIQDEDDKYLDALQKSIDKQRKLRDQAKSYDDLEKDEKRLALLERDTSGANAAEIAALREQIKNSRQNLVDTEQDNIVNNISEQNADRKKKMDEETTFLQNIMDERTYDMQYYLDRARDIVDAAINGDAGAYQQLLDIRHKAEEEFFKGTAETQALFDEDLQSEIAEAQNWAELVQTGYSKIATSTRSEIITTSGTLATSLSGLSGYSEKINDVKEAIHLLDEGEAFTEIRRGLDDAIKKIDDFWDKCKNRDYTIEVPIVYKDEGDGSNGSSGKGRNSSTDAIAEPDIRKVAYDTSSYKNIGVIDTNNIAYKGLAKSGSPIEFRDVDLNSLPTEEAERLKNYQWGGAITSEYKNKYYRIEDGEINLNEPYEEEQLMTLRQFNAEEWAYVDSNGDILQWDGKKFAKKVTKFAEGGLVNYTGPAWVDGSPAKPEAFLSVSDTRNIQTLTEVLSTLVSPSRSISAPERTNVKSGDTNLEIHIDVEQLADDYDVNQLLDVMQERISEASEGNVTIVK